MFMASVLVRDDMNHLMHALELELQARIPTETTRELFTAYGKL